MRRILAGIVSGAVGAVVYLVLVVLFPRFADSEIALVAVTAVVVGTYGAIDWLGVLPAPFREQSSILHARDDDTR